MSLRAVMILALSMMIWGLPAAAATIAGKVVNAANKVPLAGVSIEVEASGHRKALPFNTSEAGEFSFDPAMHFSVQELDTYALIIAFTKNGYRSVTRVFPTEQRGHFRVQGLVVALENISAAPSIQDEVLHALRRNKSSTGTTLFMIPYAFESESQTPLAEKLNRTLKFHLKRGINAHLQSLETKAMPPDVGVSSLPVEIEAGNTEQVRAYGTELNALAMVSGMAFVSCTPDQGGVDVSSEYLIIPAVAQFQPSTLYVDDFFQLKEVQSSRLFERLHALWGQNTVLALSLAEAGRALESGDRKGLERALDYLDAEKKQAGPGSDVLVRHINALTAIIEEELGL